MRIRRMRTRRKMRIRAKTRRRTRRMMMKRGMRIWTSKNSRAGATQVVEEELEIGINIYSCILLSYNY